MLRRNQGDARNSFISPETAMKLYADRLSGHHIVTALGPGWLEVDGRRHLRSLLLTPSEIDSHWGPNSGAALDEAHIARLADFAGHVLLLGTGVRQRFPAPPMMRSLIEAGLALDVMDTDAACRTYNILVAEGRAVVAALIIE
jgi:uncharacterized protein